MAVHRSSGSWVRIEGRVQLLLDQLLGARGPLGGGEVGEIDPADLDRAGRLDHLPRLAVPLMIGGPQDLVPAAHLRHHAIEHVQIERSHHADGGLRVIGDAVWSQLGQEPHLKLLVRQRSAVLTGVRGDGGRAGREPSSWASRAASSAMFGCSKSRPR